MSAHLINARNEFWRAYSAVRASLEKLPRHEITDLQHDAEHAARKMQMPFSERAAAQLVHAACTQLLDQ